MLILPTKRIPLALGKVLLRQDLMDGFGSCDEDFGGAYADGVAVFCEHGGVCGADGAVDGYLVELGCQ